MAYSKLYSRVNWENEPSIDTPVNEDNLNNMDEAIDGLDNRTIAMDNRLIAIEELEPRFITYMSRAETAADKSEDEADESKSYAVGGTGTRTGEDSDNAKYYKEQADNDASAASASATSSQTYSNTSKSYAVGTNNTVRQGDATDNSKYYKEQAATSASNASTSATNASASATLARSYARGDTSSRTGEETDNAKYYKERSALSASASANSASQAASSATDSANSATQSASSATASASSAAQSANSATASSNSATQAASSATLSANSASQAHGYADEAHDYADEAQQRVEDAIQDVEYPTTFTNTGESFALPNTKEGSALIHKVYGMSVQDGTPTPSSPVEIKSAKADYKCVGKNLVPYPYYTASGSTNQGMTATYGKDGIITVNKVTGSNTAFFNLSQTFFLEPNTRYIISMELENATNTSCYLNVNNSDIVAIRNKATGYYEQAFTTPSTITNYYGGFYWNKNTIETNCKIKLMIRLADVTDQTYEPYKSTDITTDLTLRAIEVSSTDDYNLIKDGKYYIADTLDWSEDRGYEVTRRINRFYTKDGTSITYQAGTTGEGYINVYFQTWVNSNFVGDVSTGRTPIAMCNTHQNKGTNETTSNCFFILNAGLSNQLVRLNVPSEVTDSTTALTWLSNNDVYVDFILATPTTEPITSEQAQALLSMKTYDFVTNISATGEVSPMTQLEYTKGRVAALALQSHNEAYIAQELEGLYGVKNLIPYPYYQTTQTVLGITTTDNGDGTLTFNGTSTSNGVIFRITSNDATVEIPLCKAVYKLTWVEREKHSNKFRVDIGITKSDGTTQVISGESGKIIVDNTDGKYIGIFSIAVYTASGVTVNNLTFKPMLRLASIQSDEYQPYAMTNYELTKKIKELETALLELGGN